MTNILTVLEISALVCMIAYIILSL